uniref:DNA-directed RNA polymerase n=1 Tax=Heterorhabditis bacteriophora TaxID=37862 RepID=A0A1I7WC74_HETBA
MSNCITDFAFHMMDVIQRDYEIETAEDFRSKIVHVRTMMNELVIRTSLNEQAAHRGIFPPGQSATIGVDFMIKTVKVDSDKIKVFNISGYHCLILNKFLKLIYINEEIFRYNSNILFRYNNYKSDPSTGTTSVNLLGKAQTQINACCGRT